MYAACVESVPFRDLTNELSGPNGAAPQARRAYNFFGARRAFRFIHHGPFQRMLEVTPGLANNLVAGADAQQQECE
jgi:hypothetical protein